MILTQVYDEHGRWDYETILEDRLVKYSDVARTLHEFAHHPNNGGELIVTSPNENEINVVLYNGYNE